MKISKTRGIYEPLHNVCMTHGLDQRQHTLEQPQLMKTLILVSSVEEMTRMPMAFIQQFETNNN